MEDFNVFGRAISDYFSGEKQARITVHSEGFKKSFILCKQLFRSVSKLPELEKVALVHCKGNILDIGAGAGSHALILQEMGMSVIALEVSKEAAETMVARGVKEVRNSDLFDFKDEKFDTLLLLMNGIGIAGTLSGLDAFLLKLKELLNPDGIVIAESSDLLYFADPEEEEAALRAEEYYGQVSYQLEYKGMKGKAFNWLFVDFYTLCSYTSKHGFKTDLLYEDMEGGYLVKLSLSN